MTATHTREELDQALETLKRVGKRMGILGVKIDYVGKDRIFRRGDSRSRA